MVNHINKLQPTYYPWLLVALSHNISCTCHQIQVADYEAGISVFQVQSLGPVSKKNSVVRVSRLTTSRCGPSRTSTMDDKRVKYSCAKEKIISNVDLKHFSNVLRLPEDENTRMEESVVCKQQSKILMKTDKNTMNLMNDNIGPCPIAMEEFHRIANYLWQL